jgi:hypothetical protein
VAVFAFFSVVHTLSVLPLETSRLPWVASNACIGMAALIVLEYLIGLLYQSAKEQMQFPDGRIIVLFGDSGYYQTEAQNIEPLLEAWLERRLSLRNADETSKSLNE